MRRILNKDFLDNLILRILGLPTVRQEGVLLLNPSPENDRWAEMVQYLSQLSRLPYPSEERMREMQRKTHHDNLSALAISERVIYPSQSN